MDIVERLHRHAAELDSLDDMKADIREGAWEIERLRAENDALRRGEFICQRCGLRKDAEHGQQPDF